MKGTAPGPGESPVITIRNAAATAKITVHKLRGNLSVLKGSGGNITVLTGHDGKVLVDAGISTLAPKCYRSAHTDSDISVEFQEANVIAVADTFWNGEYPFIDYGTGGSLDGMIRAAEANVANTDDESIVIPGHGPIGNKSQLIEFRDMLVAIRQKVANLKKQGKSLEEAVAAKPTADYDAKWGGFIVDGSFFTRLVYVGV